MNNQILTTKEVAEYIKLNEKTVIKMAQDGKLPAVKLGNKWRFMLSAIDAHLQKSIVNSPDEDLDEIIRTGDNVVPVSRLAEASLINLDFKAGKPDDVLEELARMAEAAELTESADKLLVQLNKRERLLSTSIGSGIALPHPRNPHLGLFRRPRIVFLRTKKGIDFSSPDGFPTNLFFMICATNSFVHIRMLAKISKVLHVPGMIDKFAEAESKDDIISALLELERLDIMKEGDE